jgi:hypothetical protein
MHDQQAERLSISLWEIVLKSALAHSVTYFLVGVVASLWLDYEHWFAESRLHCFMRPMSEPLVMAGPLFQPLRGALFGAAFYVLKEPLLHRQQGWLSMWLVLVVLGIVNTFGPTAGSLEGMIYTTLSWRDHMRGLPEVIVQSLLLSLSIFHWLKSSRPRRWNWTLGAAFVVVMALPVLGLLA